ncbi:hypothetical protein RFI_09737, partial [Reticulomyxa filosa]
QQQQHQKKKQKKEKAMDDIFLTQHLWESPNDLYIQLQNERKKLTERCVLYTVGVDHVLLRVFLFILLLWLTHIMLLFTITLIPIVPGRLIRSLIIPNALFFIWFVGYIFVCFVLLCQHQHHICTQIQRNSKYNNNKQINNINNIKKKQYFHSNRSDIAAYFTGVLLCVQLPYEIYQLHLHYNGGQLWRKMKKGIVRLFLFLFFPFTFGYGWMIMGFHFTHPIFETPLLPLAEMYCTGVYITSVYLLLQDQERIQDVIRWIQGQMDIDLWRFWNDVAKKIFQSIVVHLSFPIALRYILLHFFILPRQSDFQLSTLMIDINAIQGHGEFVILRNFHFFVFFIFTCTLIIYIYVYMFIKGGQSPLNTTLPLNVRYDDPDFQNISFDYYRRWDERTTDQIKQVKKEINQSALTIESIVEGDVSLHYNLHEYWLFLHRSPIQEFVQQLLAGNLRHTLLWFDNTYNIKVWKKFIQFLCELLILRCPIVILLWVRLNYELSCIVVSKVPSIKEHFLMQKFSLFVCHSALHMYGGNRKLVNYSTKANPQRNENEVAPVQQDAVRLLGEDPENANN